MELTPEHLAVLYIFKEHNVGRGQYLPIQTLNQERLNLPQRIQEDWDNIILKLRNLGYIIYDPLGYSLAEKAYGYVCHSAEWSGSLAE